MIRKYSNVNKLLVESKKLDIFVNLVAIGKMFNTVFVVLCFVPSITLSSELSIVWDSNMQSYGLRKGKVDNYISLVNFKNDINKTGYVCPVIVEHLNNVSTFACH